MPLVQEYLTQVHCDGLPRPEGPHFVNQVGTGEPGRCLRLRITDPGR
jgi:hypothetical protein